MKTYTFFAIFIVIFVRKSEERFVTFSKTIDNDKKIEDLIDFIMPPKELLENNKHLEYCKIILNHKSNDPQVKSCIQWLKIQNEKVAALEQVLKMFATVLSEIAKSQNFVQPKKF